jgi:hypothetical protein
VRTVCALPRLAGSIAPTAPEKAGGIDIGVVLVQAIDGSRQHAVARVGFPLRLFRASLRLHKPPPTESAVPSPSEIGVVPPGAAVRSRAEVSRGRLPTQLDRVCRRSSGGAEVNAGDAVRMIAMGPLTRR